jgi:hypothetical protein
VLSVWLTFLMLLLCLGYVAPKGVSLACTMSCFYGLNCATACVCLYDTSIVIVITNQDSTSSRLLPVRFYDISMGHYKWFVVTCNDLSLKTPADTIAPSLGRRATPCRARGLTRRRMRCSNAVPNNKVAYTRRWLKLVLQPPQRATVP